MIDTLLSFSQIAALLPALPLLLAGVIVAWRGVPAVPVMAVGSLLSLVLVWTATPPASEELVSLGRLFGTVFAGFALAAGIYAGSLAKRSEMAAGLLSAGAAVGIAMARDFVALFIFWELLAVASAVLISAAGTAKARSATRRYLALHILGGTILMAGIAGHAATTGSIALAQFDATTLPQQLMLAGVLINAAAVPLHAWLPDAYPEASPFGSLFLSAFTTKSAVFVLLAFFPGVKILIGIGVIMIFYGIIYALLENDVRRILSYSIMNQVGFMVTAAGIGTPLAINGGAAHAFCHIIYKGLLMMSAGAVTYQTGGLRRCTDMGGLIKSMPRTAVCGIIGALAISAVPLTSGFVAKSVVVSAASELHMVALYLALQAAAAGVFLHAGIKFPWFVFFNRDSGLRPPEPPRNMLYAMYALAALCVGLGLTPQFLYGLLPYPMDYQPYTADHVLLQMQLLLFAALAFFMLLRLMRRTETISLDLDWTYRRLLPGAARWSLAGGQMLVRQGAAATAALGRQADALRTGWLRTRQVLSPLGVQLLLVAAFLSIFLTVHMLTG